MVTFSPEKEGLVEKCSLETVEVETVETAETAGTVEN